MAKVPERFQEPNLVPGHRVCQFSSTAASDISYDGGKRELYVTWTGGGGPYTYYGVSEPVYRALCAAPSKGKFLNRVIKGDPKRSLGGGANYRYSRG